MLMKDLLKRRLFHACCGCVLISLFLIYSLRLTAPDEEKQVVLLQNTPGHQIHLKFHQNKAYEPGSSDKHSRRNNDQENSATGSDGPSLEMELARRHITQTSADMLLFVNYHLKTLKDSLKENVTHEELFQKQEELLKYILNNLVEYQSVMEDQVKVLADNDGWSSWRKAEAEDLQETMKRRLYALQNPSNCSQAPVLLCDLKSTSGFGSGLHDILWCFIKAYYLNMRMVLITSSWHYAPGGWETLFKPVSDNCNNNEGIVAATGPGGNNNKDRGLLRVLPSDLGPRIIRIHSSPLAWWYGQFFGYLMRPNDKLKAFLEDFKTKINFSKPIIGIHVRRTDKVKEEAKGHSLEEYMQHVDNYFVGQELKELQVQRKIYLATDDPTVIQECHDKFKKYICVSNSQAALTASNMTTRYSNSSLWGVLADVFMLANTDYLVCTFSSNGRLLGLIFAAVVSITVLSLLYLRDASISSVESIIPFRQNEVTYDEVVLNQGQQQDNGVEIEALENGTLSSAFFKRNSAMTPDETDFKDSRGPSLEMELTRRRIAQASRDMWLFSRHQLKRLQHINNFIAFDIFKQQDKIIKFTLDNLAEYHSAITDQIKNLSNSDGWNSWRKQEAQSLQTIIQKRLYALQNPKNCSSAPVLLCNLTCPHGFASGVHDVLWCFIKAYYHHRRMVLITSSWHYAPDGWETIFRPLTDTCGNQTVTPDSFGPGDNDDKSRRLMALLPRDLGPRILRIHGNPLAWWYGQFILYLMRPNVKLKTILQNLKQEINFEDPIVGVHVRRTDKIGNEAKSHELEEYMEYVDYYFAGKEMVHFTPTPKRIYLATDDPGVIMECRNRFKEYLCVCNSEASTVASNIHTRYSKASLWGVLADVFMLANTDFLVCTFSSGLCRLAYELMQALKPEDASNRFISLDVQYHYAWLLPTSRSAIYNHRGKSEKELSFKIGDAFRKKDEYSIVYEAIRGKKNSGFGYFVKAWQRGKEGLVPVFKTKEIHKFTNTKDFADYDPYGNYTN